MHYYQRFYKYVLISVFLIVSTHHVYSAEYIDSYKADSQGTLNRQVTNWAGQLSSNSCVLYCGCQGYSYAYFKSSECWCGDNIEICNLCSQDVLEKRNATGYSSSFSSFVPSKVDFYDFLYLASNYLPTTVSNAIVINRRATFTNAGYFLFPYPGSYFVSTLMNGPECCSADLNITVTAVANVTVFLSEQIAYNATSFDVDIIISGTDILNLNVSVFSVSGEKSSVLFSKIFPNASGSIYLPVGGVTETDMFKVYEKGPAGPYLSVNLDHQVFEDGEILSFEGHVVALGEITFVVLELFCIDPNLLVDYSTKSCIINGNQNPYFYNSSSIKKDLSGGFMEFSFLGYSATLNTDLRVLFVYSVNATMYGNQVFHLPKNMTFNVSAGQVIGWLSSGTTSGVLGRYDQIDQTRYPTVYFKRINNVTVGDTISKALVTSSELYEHMLQMHIEVKARYRVSIESNFSNGGDIVSYASVIANNGYEALASNDSYVVFPITGFNVTSKTLLLKDEVFNLSFIFATGKRGAKICIDWGEEYNQTEMNCDEITELDVTNHSYSIGGIYNIQLLAYSQYFYQETSLDVFVYCSCDQKLININASSDEDVYLPSNIVLSLQPIIINVYFSGCGIGYLNYTITAVQYNVPDNIIEGSLLVFLGDDSLFTIEIPGFSVYTNITAVVFLDNLVQRNQSIIYLESIVPLSCLPINDFILETNQFMEILVKTEGTQDNCTIYWGNSSISFHKRNSLSDITPISVNVSYSVAKTYSVNILCQNKLSQCNSSFQAFIQDPPNVTVLSPDVLFLSESKAFFIVYIGTNLTIKAIWYLADGSIMETQPAVGINPNMPRNLSFPYKFKNVMGVSSVSNLTLGAHQVCFNVHNDIMNSFYCSNHRVLEKVQAPLLQIVSLDNNVTNYFEQNEILTIQILNFDANKNISYTFNFSDGTVVNTSNSSIKYSYLKWKMCYSVEVTAWNNLSKASNFTDICVYEPVINISNGSINASSPENSTEIMNIIFTFLNGFPFNCTVNYNDNSAEKFFSSDTLTSSFFSSSTTKKIVDISHQYEKPGIYNLTVLCVSRLYTNIYFAEVISENYVTRPSLNIRALCFNGFKVIEKLPIFNIASDMILPFGCNISICTMDQYGTNVTVNISISVDGVYAESQLNQANCVVFPVHSDKEKSLLTFDVFSKNSVSQNYIQYNASILQKVLGFNVTLTNAPSINVPAKIKIVYLNTPGDACVSVNFGDSSPKISNQPNLLVFGDYFCQNLDEYLGFVYQPGKPVGGESLMLSRQFYSGGLYQVIIDIKNVLSNYTVVLPVKVVDFPCFPANISFLSSVGSNLKEAEEAAQFPKCENITLKFKALPNCKRPNVTMKKFVTISKVDNISMSVSKPLLETNESLYTIYGNLGYGWYQIDYEVKMVDTNDGHTIPDTQSSINGFFSIIPCSLRIKVKEGNGFSAKKGGLVYINALNSSDPDDSKAILNPKWFCSPCNTVNESINFNTVKNLMYPIPKVALDDPNFVGCFGKEPFVGKLSDKGHNSLILQLDTSFMKAGCYDIWLLLSVNGAIKQRTKTEHVQLILTDTEPLVPQIKCKMNCLEKINPNSKLTFESVLINKESCNLEKQSLTKFNWAILQKYDIQQNLYEDVTLNFLNQSFTGFQQQNLVLMANALPYDYSYKFKLTAVCEGLTVGFTEINKDLNTPPDVSNASCSLNPQNGSAMDTDFEIKCFGVRDNDLPLTYTYLYRCGDSDAVWEDLTLASSVYPPIVSKLKLPCNISSISKDCQVKVIVKDSYGMSSQPIFGPSMIVNVKCPVSINPPSNTLRKKREISDDVPLCEKINDTNIKYDQGLLTNYMVVLNKMIPFLNPSAKDFCQKKVQESLRHVEVDSPDSAFILLSNIGLPPSPPPSPISKNSSSIPSAAEQNEIEKAKADAAVQLLGTMKSTLDVLDKFTPEQLSAFASMVFSMTAILTGNLKSGLAAEAVKAAMEIETKISFLAVSQMSVGEAPHVLSTSLGEISMRSIDSTQPASFGGFSYSSLGDATSGGGFGAVSSVGANRYSYDKSAKNIKGSVLGLSLADKNGQAKKIANLTQPIYIVLNNTEIPPPIKNFTAYCQLMRDIHRIDATVNSSVIVAYVRPVLENFTGNFFIFLNKGTAPSLIDHQLNCTLPNQVPDNWDSMTSAEQWYWNLEKKWTCFWDQSVLNGTAIGIWCAGIVFYYNNSLTTKLLSMSALPSEDTCDTPVKYYYQAYTRSCLFWNDAKNTWDGEGCTVVEYDTNINQTKCACNHLTNFGGGGPFASPEPINLSATLANINIADNPVVFSVMISIFCLYIILLVWARRKDNQDRIKSQINLLPCNHPSDTYFYEIRVQTGFKKGSSTTADVFLTIFGEEGETPPRRLCCDSKKCFQNGEIDIFFMSVPKSLGELKEIEIRHNNGGHSPGWHCVQVSIKNLQDQQVVEFICNRWLDLIEDDGLICRKLQPAEKEEKENFSYLFSINLIKNLYDGHIWFSIFTKPVLSTFTRCQRLATCTTLLFTTMMTNCMFYRGDDSNKPSDSITLGFVTISVDQLRVAFSSIAIATPLNLIIITLFKYAGPPKTLKHQKYEVSQNPKPYDLSTQSSMHVKIIKFFQSIIFFGKEEEEEEKSAKKSMPHWLIYIGYVLAFSTCVVCAFFIFTYSMAFGKVKANKWMVAMTFTFLQSIFIIEVVKVILLSIFFSSVLKKTPKTQPYETNPLKQNQQQTADYSEELVKKFEKEFKMPDTRKLEEAKKSRLKDKEIKTIVKEILIHVLLLSLYFTVAFSVLDPSAANLYSSVNQLCTKNGLINSPDIPTADGIASITDWWDWIMHSVVEYLFPDGWYNNMKYEKGFAADNAASKVLSMARIRQIRVKPMSCEKHPVFKYLIDQCNAAYGYNVEETDDYKAGWLPPLNQTERFRRRRGKRKAIWKGFEDPWLYQSSSILNNPFPFTGKFAVYYGSSYSVSIGPKKHFANRILKDMKNNFWVDRYTRALFTEMNLYNANTNMMLIVTYLHEILPTGGWNFYSNIQSLRLYRYNGGLGQITILFDLVFCVVAFVQLYKIFKAVRQKSFVTYICNVWNSFHVIVTISSITAIIVQVGRMFAVKSAVALYLQDSEIFISFQYVGILEYIFQGAIGIVLFFVTMELIRILRFNHKINRLTKIFGIIGSPLASFAILFLTVFIAYVSLAYFLYVAKLEEYATFISSFVNLTQMFLGKFSVQQYFDNAPVFGPFLFASYMIFITMIMINLFVGVICGGFVEMHKPEEKEPTNVLDFISTRVKSIASGSEVVHNPIYLEWADDWDNLISGFSELCDNCIYMMRNIENENLRHIKFFESADKKKKNLLKTVLNSDLLIYENDLCDGITMLERKLKEISTDGANLSISETQF
ncbi:uncharacterized protein LOC100211692 isoform X4 [Hydra vulgaris]|uniref:Uncharacterized protein LOC100211692 isoform X4 n=1 Tax=Hydra vulgaris TaxID=6087 RepID=A0ABM4C9L5_HYDVU